MLLSISSYNLMDLARLDVMLWSVLMLILLSFWLIFRMGGSYGLILHILLTLVRKIRNLGLKYLRLLSMGGLRRLIWSILFRILLRKLLTCFIIWSKKKKKRILPKKKKMSRKERLLFLLQVISLKVNIKIMYRCLKMLNLWKILLRNCWLLSRKILICWRWR